MGKQLRVRRVWNLRVDEGPQIFRKLNSKDLEEVGMKPRLRAETLGEDKGKLTYRLHSPRWRQAKMHF